MRFSVFIPPGDGPFPAVFWLSGLTCTHENFVSKAGAQRFAAEHGIVMIAPDTSPRGEGVADAPDGAYDLGLGAGFYLDATEAPWAEHYKMYTYVTDELYKLIVTQFPVDPVRIGISGHSMGGHGALTLHLRHPELFRSCTAFAPIVAPSKVPWGQKAFTTYLGTDERFWAPYDACQLLEDHGKSFAHILIDQGLADQFLDEQLQPERLEVAAREVDQALTVRRHEDYDHSYFFIATFIDDHLRWHLQGWMAPSDNFPGV